MHASVHLSSKPCPPLQFKCPQSTPCANSSTRKQLIEFAMPAPAAGVEPQQAQDHEASRTRLAPLPALLLLLTISEAVLARELKGSAPASVSFAM